MSYQFGSQRLNMREHTKAHEGRVLWILKATCALLLMIMLHLCGVVLQLLGYAIIKKIVNIEV